MTKHFKKKDYTKAEVNTISKDNKSLEQSVAIAKYIYSLDFDSLSKAYEDINGDLTQITERLNFHLNKSFKGRTTGDNIDDINDKKYGNNNVKPVKKDESHGTHVAGIIAATRNNGKGANGVANNVKIM